VVNFFSEFLFTGLKVFVVLLQEEINYFRWVSVFKFFKSLTLYFSILSFLVDVINGPEEGYDTWQDAVCLLSAISAGPGYSSTDYIPVGQKAG